MKVIVLFFLLTLFSCKAVDKTPDIIVKPNDFINNTWEVYNNVDSIPRALIKYMHSLAGIAFSIVNPTDDYQSTDMIDNPPLPVRQLIFTAHFKNKWVLAYKHGGIGLHSDIIICKIKGDVISDFRIAGSGSQISGFEVFRQELVNENVYYFDTSPDNPPHI